VPRRKDQTTLNNLSVGQLLEGCEQALVTGRALLDEATLLLDHGREARAFVLAQFSSEEVSKVLMLYSAAENVKAGVKVDWKMLNFRFRSHDWKSVGLAIHSHRLSLPDDQRDSQTVKEVITSGLVDEFAQLSPMRELALYVNYTREHGFIAPHDMNWRDEAVQAIEQARRAIEFFEMSLPTNANVLRGELTDLQREQLMRQVRERHEMVDDAEAQAEAEGWAE
jgi:AbiV family abortive infection protein